MPHRYMETHVPYEAGTWISDQGGCKVELV